MYISSSKPSPSRSYHQARTPNASPQPLAVVPSQVDEVRIPFKERAVTSAIVGASVGAIGGEKIGGLGFIGGLAYGGHILGSALSAVPIAGPLGLAVGAVTGYVVEKNLNIGKILGGAAGFVTGGIVGGVTGSVIAGASSVLNSDLFQ